MAEPDDKAKDPPSPDSPDSEQLEQQLEQVLVQDAELRPEKAQRIARGLVRVTATASWQAPLPPPEIIRGYEELVPGAAAKIIETFTDEVASRHSRERMQSFAQLLGLVFGFVAILAMLALAAYATSRGEGYVAGVTIGALAAVAAVFVASHKMPSKKDEQKP